MHAITIHELAPVRSLSGHKEWKMHISSMRYRQQLIEERERERERKMAQTERALRERERAGRERGCNCR